MAQTADSVDIQELISKIKIPRPKPLTKAQLRERQEAIRAILELRAKMQPLGMTAAALVHEARAENGIDD